jgi:hypothetical protein
LFAQVIDKNGPPPKGTGIKQLRENIAESKLSYEIMDDAAQAFLKTKIMDNIQVKIFESINIQAPIFKTLAFNWNFFVSTNIQVQIFSNTNIQEQHNSQAQNFESTFV